MPDTLGYDYDLILSHLGDFGSFQKRILVLLSLVSAVGGLAVVVFPFTAFVPSYRFRRLKVVCTTMWIDILDVESQVLKRRRVLFISLRTQLCPHGWETCLLMSTPDAET